MNGAWNYSNMWFKNLLEIWAHDDKTPLPLSALNDDSEVRNVCFLHNSRYRIITFSQMRRQNVFKGGFNISQIKSSHHRSFVGHD